jgi:hypothetical protein
MKIRLYPIPTSGQTYYVHYVPTTTTIDDSADVLRGINGWEEWIVWDVAIKCLLKEDRDPRNFMQERDRFFRERLDYALNLRRARPAKVQEVDIHRRDDADWWPWSRW